MRDGSCSRYRRVDRCSRRRHFVSSSLPPVSKKNQSSRFRGFRKRGLDGHGRVSTSSLLSMTTRRHSSDTGELAVQLGPFFQAPGDVREFEIWFETFLRRDNPMWNNCHLEFDSPRVSLDSNRDKIALHASHCVHEISSSNTNASGASAKPLKSLRRARPHDFDARRVHPRRGKRARGYRFFNASVRMRQAHMFDKFSEKESTHFRTHFLDQSLVLTARCCPRARASVLSSKFQAQTVSETPARISFLYRPKVEGKLG